MTREEARKAAEVMKAYADGKKIEYKSNAIMNDKWFGYDDDSLPKFNWRENDYRIKPEPTYRPFKNAKECWEEMLKHQPFGWIRNGVYYQLIRNVNNASIYVDYFVKEFNYEEALGDFIFIDGTPFGIKEE